MIETSRRESKESVEQKNAKKRKKMVETVRKLYPRKKKNLNQEKS